MEKKKGKKQQQTYQHKQNAVCITVYDMYGNTIPAEIRHEAENAMLDIVLKNNLLMNIALT